MNYIKEINAFYDWLELNELSKSAVLLWHALMHLNNKSGWQESFTVARSVIEAKTGLKKDAYYKARNQLKQAGLIDFKERGTKATVFKIFSFDSPGKQTITQTNDDKLSEKQTRSQTKSQTTTQTRSQTKSQTINKLNETKLNETNNAAADEREDAVVFFEKNFGITSPFIIEQIEAWVSDFDSDEIVIAAMKIALKKGANSFGYCEPILKEWHQKGLRSIQAIRAYEANKQTKSKRINKRVESIPKWMTDPNWGKTETSDEEFQKRVKDLEGLLSNL